MKNKYILSIDQGTTSTRAIIFDKEGQPRWSDQKGITQIYPQPGWVEHDANEIWIKTLQVIAGALPAGILGIGEPLIYGVTLPLGKPFITAGLGAGFGGAYVMMMGVMANAWGPSGWVALPLMQPGKMMHYAIGVLISYVGGFIITRAFIKEKDVLNV